MRSDFTDATGSFARDQRHFHVILYSLIRVQSEFDNLFVHNRQRFIYWWPLYIYNNNL